MSSPPSDLQAPGKILVFVFALMTLVGNIFFITLWDTDRRSSEYRFSKNASGISQIEGVLSLIKVSKNKYWLNLQSDNEITVFNCYGTARMPSELGGCTINKDIVKIIDGRTVTIDWYQIPKIYWYYNPYKQLKSISLNGNKVIDKNKKTLKSKKFRRSTNIALFILFVVLDIFMFSILYFLVKAYRKASQCI